jgi:hypothetical protein
VVSRRQQPGLAPGDAVEGTNGERHEVRRAEPRLLRLCRAQHRQDSSRAWLARDTPAWDEATTRLETLNDQIVHLASTGNLPRESLGADLELELDSRPEEDLAFRRSVLANVRRTVLARVTENLAPRSQHHLRASDARIRATASLLDRVEGCLRAEHPRAFFAATAANPVSITLIADRNGRSA